MNQDDNVTAAQIIAKIRDLQQMQIYRNLSIQERQQSFDKNRRIILSGSTIAVLVLIAIQLGFGFLITLIQVLWIKMIFMMIFAIFSANLIVNILTIIKTLTPLFQATGYATLDAAFFVQYIKIMKNRPSNSMVAMASQMSVELEEFNKSIDADAKKKGEVYELVEMGPIIGKIDNFDILDYVKIKNRETGEYRILKYAGYHKTDPLSEFHRISKQDQLGYIHNSVIYLE